MWGNLCYFKLVMNLKPSISIIIENQNPMFKRSPLSVILKLEDG